MRQSKIEKERNQISMDREITELRTLFETIEDKRAKNASHKLSDIFMSGFAMFSLKHGSLLEFNQQTVFEKSNVKTVYGIDSLCSDDQLRHVLDTHNPDFMRIQFVKQFKKLKNVGILKEYAYKIGSVEYLIASCDGVQHFSSKSISCPCCLKKTHKDGSFTYHHNMLCVALVHPNKRETFILNVEPMVQQDGVLKNDCELNAAKRLQKNMKLDYANYQKEYNFLFVEDALYANAPHIQELRSNGFGYILNVKPDSHKTLFAQIEGKRQRNELKRHKIVQNGITHEFEYVNNVLLCNAAPNVRVNFVQYRQTDKQGKTTTFTWITDIVLASNKLFNIMQTARARWKIENETFNTLKNLGYKFEHNYGHGKDHLATLFAYLMLYAFYLDQLIQACCHIFKEIQQCVTTKIRIWSAIRALFQTTECLSMNLIYQSVHALFKPKID
jgi:Transposase DDE domain